MNIVWFLAPMALVFGSGFLVAFLVSARRGQFDDLETPAHRMLLDDSDSISLRPERAPEISRHERTT